MSDIAPWKVAAAVSAAFASGTVATLLWKEFHEKKTKPERWVRVGTVSEVMIYPVKSCRGISVDEATPTEIGFQVAPYFRDRIFMVVDSKGVLKRMTDLPKLTLITPVLNEDTLMLSAPDTDSLIVKIPKDSPELRRSCRLYGEKVESVLDCGSAVSVWLSSFVNAEVRLYYHHTSHTQREKLTPDQSQFAHFSKRDKGSFQDETSYMFATEESIAELNTRLETPVTHLSFRPNIVIKGTPEPFSEDLWGFVRIGNEGGTVFKAAAPCLRCKVTNIDPETGKTNIRGDPQRTIHKMKRKLWNEEMDKICRTKAVFGLHLGLYELGGNVKKGDPVYAAVL